MQKVKIYGWCAIILAFCLSACNNQSGRVEDVKLIPVWYGDSCRYIDEKDEMAFNGLYPAVSLFREDVALVQTPGRDSRFGFIDDTGEFVLPAVYKRATIFSEGLAFVVRPGEAPCAINQKGELKFTLRDAETAEIYHEGLSLYSVKEKGKRLYGYVDREGETVIKPTFSDAASFSGEKASVRDANGKWGFINKKGDIVIECRFDEVGSFGKKDMAIVRVKKMWGLIDEHGEYVIEPQYSMMKRDGDWCQIKQDNRWGWCDSDGETVIPVRYEQVFAFFEGDRAPVLIDGKWAYIDRKGEVAIKPQFDRALPFVGNLAAVWIGDYIGFINRDGLYEINPQYNGLSRDYEANAIWGGTSYDSVTTDK